MGFKKKSDTDKNFGILTRKYRIYPNDEQKQVIDYCIDVVRSVYNTIVFEGEQQKAHYKALYEEHKNDANYPQDKLEEEKKLSSHIPYPMRSTTEYNETHKDISSCVVATAVQNFKNAKDRQCNNPGEVGDPKYKRRGKRTEFGRPYRVSAGAYDLDIRTSLDGSYNLRVDTKISYKKDKNGNDILEEPKYLYLNLSKTVFKLSEEERKIALNSLKEQKENGEVTNEEFLKQRMKILDKKNSLIKVRLHRELPVGLISLGTHAYIKKEAENEYYIILTCHVEKDKLEQNFVNNEEYFRNLPVNYIWDKKGKEYCKQEYEIAMQENPYLKNVLGLDAHFGDVFSFIASNGVEYRISDEALARIKKTEKKKHKTEQTIDRIERAYVFDRIRKDIKTAEDNGDTETATYLKDLLARYIDRKKLTKSEDTKIKSYKKEYIPSQNWIDAWNKMEKLNAKLTKQKKYNYRNLAHQICSIPDLQVICIEDLDYAGIRRKPIIVENDEDEITERERLSGLKFRRNELGKAKYNSIMHLKRTFRKVIQDYSPSEFCDILNQIADKKHITFVRANTYYKSTKTCFMCKGVNTKEELQGLLGLETRDWYCPHCNARHERDLNAALNLACYGWKHRNDTPDEIKARKEEIKKMKVVRTKKGKQAVKKDKVAKEVSA